MRRLTALLVILSAVTCHVHGWWGSDEPSPAQPQPTESLEQHIAMATVHCRGMFAQDVAELTGEGVDNRQ